MAELFAKYNCTNCQEDIPGIRVHCSECTDFDLCLQCFAAGAEIGPHRNDHSYQFMKVSVKDPGVLTLSRGKAGWSAQEELHLLDAIEKFGFGNWEDISKHIETRSPEDSKEEYINKYLNGTIGRHTWSPVSKDQRLKLTDHSADDKGPLSQLLTERLPPLDVTPEEALQLQFMPHRNVFDREYDPTAETIVSNLSLNPDDEDTDLMLKLAHIDIYTRRLRERARRKRIVRDYQLIYQFFRGNANKRRQTKDQREFRDRFRVFAQFYSAHEFDRRIASLEREKALRMRLSELCRYRWNGLTRIDECVHFEQHAAAVQNKNTGPYGTHGRTDNRTNGERHPLSSHSLAKRGGESEKIVNSNSIGQKSMSHIGDQVSFEGSLHSRNSLDSYQRLDMPAAQQPGVQLLTNNEIQLCTNLKLPPTRYITLKTVMLSGAPCNSNSATEKTIRKYLVKAGWLQQQQQLQQHQSNVS